LDERFVEYVSNRFQKGSIPRVAVVPFEVPVNFSPIMNPELRYGFKLAQMFQQSLLSQNEKIIVEVFDRSNWPGKKMDFATGNMIAMKQARDAGYDFLVVGVMDEMTNANNLSIQTKLIDTENSTTVWYGISQSVWPRRPTQDFLNFLSRGIYPKRDDVFEIQDRTKKLVDCTVDRLIRYKFEE